MSFALFFINKQYTSDECELITLEQHLRNVEYGATPDLWDSFDKISEACEEANKQVKYCNNPCVVVDLDDPTTILETFKEVSE